MKQGIANRGWWRICAVGVLAVALAALVAVRVPAAAHGKDLDISVSRLTPNPDRPLVRLYTAMVRYAGDGDPLTGATVTMSAIRQEGGETIAAVVLTGLQATPGLYVAQLTYQHFGTFDIVLRVSAALGEGDGEVVFSDRLRPANLTDAQQAALEAEAQRVLRLQAQFGFGWWPDVTNIIGRTVHSLAGVTFFAATGLITVAAWGGAGDPSHGLLRRLHRRYALVAFGSLAVLFAAGLYSAWFDAPVRPPGVFDLHAMRRLPYGDWYLAMFALKPALFVMLAWLAVALRRQLRAWSAAADGDRPDDVRAAVSKLRLLTALNAGAGIAVFVDVAIVIYLHYVSHLGVFLPD